MKYLHTTCCLWLALILLTPVHAFSQSKIDRIDAYIQQAQRDWNVPGLAVAITRADGSVFEKGYGQLKTGGQLPINEHSIFAIASNSKAFTAAAMAMLVEEGKVNWEDPVRKYIPEFTLYDPYVSAHTQIRDLFCHRVGLGTFSGDELWYKSDLTAEALLHRLQHLPQAYPFRAGYGYSNLMYIVAGEVIRRVSGQSWAEFTQARILSPLNMDRSFTSVNPLKDQDNVASPHKLIDDQQQIIPLVNWDNMGAAGGIFSSVHDMSKWLRLQLNKGKHDSKQLFSVASQRQMWAPHNGFVVSEAAHDRFRDRNFSAYGLGWGLADYNGTFLASHGGGYDGMYSRVVLAPDLDLGIVVLTNGMKGISGALTYYILDVMMEADPRDWSQEFLERQNEREGERKILMEKYQQERRANTRPALSPDQFAGTYSDPFFGDIKIRQTDRQLVLEFPDAPKLNARLDHWHFNTYSIDWQEEHAWFDFGLLQFVLTPAGEVQGIEFDVPNGDIFFHEIHARKIPDQVKTLME